LANAADLTTIALVSNLAKSTFVAAQGADHVIDTRREDLTEQIMAITDGRGVDLFIDPVAGPGFKDHLDLLAPVGMLVLYGMIEELPTNGVFRAQCERWGRSPAARSHVLHSRL
jgi:NADPH2:quinone reductase